MDEIKNIFKQNYSSERFELADEHQDELFFKNKRGDLFRISSEDLNRYKEFEKIRKEYQAGPYECSMVSKDYREQMISPADRFMRPFMRNGRIEFGGDDCGGLRVEIGDASDEFKNYFRFNEDFFTISMDRLMRIGPGRYQSDKELWDYTFTPTTIKVFNVGAKDTTDAVKKTDPLIEGCLFNQSYLNGQVFSIDEEWPKRFSRKRPFRMDESERRDKLPLPKGKINKDIIRIYQRGMATEDPVNQFLSFYQVMEYFFVAISDEELYRKLASIINDPSFVSRPRNLDKIIHETTSHKRETDETEMLRMVISKNCDESFLQDFIKRYEAHLEESWYTKKRTLFGVDTQVNTGSGHVIGNVSKRIKLIRNSLVHSSDQYNRKETFIPSQASEDIIRKEVPMVRHLAEKVIISNSY